ncbi:MAG: DNA cytosine methyltransferase [Pirellulaceae bacterium]
MIKALELFCGIGGFAAAAPDSIQVVQAIDINRLCGETYQHNFDHPWSALSLESISTKTLERYAADLWWMSLPCQPFTVRGRRRDIEDPRCRAFLHLLECLAIVRPRHLAMENVPPFQDSRAATLLRDTLSANGYRWTESVVCPTQLGIANRRKRFYLIASQDPLLAVDVPTEYRGPWRRGIVDILEPSAADDDSLRVPDQILHDYRFASNIVSLADPASVTSCFTSAYGRSHIRSGSYLRDAKGERYFTPREIIRWLGFPDSFRFPPTISRSQCWSLAGNSLSIDVVRFLLLSVTPMD